MSGINDVEALLDAAAAKGHQEPPEPRAASDRHERRDRKREREHSRDRDSKRRDRSRDRRRRDTDGDLDMTKSPRSDRGSAHGSHKSRHRSRSRDSSRHRRRERRRSPTDDRGDYYRGPGRARTRSHSPGTDDRYYRPGDRKRSDRDEKDDKDDRDRNGRNGRGRRRSPSPRRRTKSPTPQPTEDERDRRTVFVQQLAARLRTKELIAFFEKVGPVKEAQIVKDRVSGRSKGVGYVEFKDEASVPQAIQLTGQKLLGIPIIAQLTEAEKNRQARTTESGATAANGVPFHRLYVGNIHFSITESDLQEVFEPFGELEFVQLQKEEQGRSRGYGFVQFRNPNQAKEALEHLNGFEIAGRPIRVGLGNDKFTPETTQNLLQRFNGLSQPSAAYQGSAFSGQGGRGAHAGGAGGNFDRAGGRDTDKGAGGASALDDTDVAGVNFNNFSRDALMRKLARTDDSTEVIKPDRPQVAKPRTETRSTPVNVSQASRCVLLKNCFDPAEEEGDGWVEELEGEVKGECNEKYGNVVHIAVDPNTQGDIYIKFDKVSGGERAIQGLNGRYFGGRTITAQPVVDAVYSSLFARTRAL